jgi:hypothetical protein
MLKQLYSLLRRERGDALPFALVALAVGTLLISPLMAKVGSSYNISHAASASLKRHYAVDAAAEMAVWKLTEDAAFRQQLLASPGTPQSVSMDPVNGTTPTIEVVAVATVYTQTASSTTNMLSWAIWGNNESAKQTVSIGGSGHRIHGGIHASDELKIGGEGHFFYGPIEWSRIKVVEGKHTFDPPLSTVPSANRGFPITWDPNHYRPGGAAAITAGNDYHPIVGHLHFVEDNVTIPPGLYHVYGDVKINAHGVVANNVTIVAEGIINVAGSHMTFTPYINGLTFFSTKTSTGDVISISGASNTGGTSFAPNGGIKLAGDGGTIVGAFLGDTVAMDGAGATVTLAPVQLAAFESVLASATYDVQALAGGSRITARIEQVNSLGGSGDPITSTFTIKSWYMD